MKRAAGFNPAETKTAGFNPAARQGRLDSSSVLPLEILALTRLANAFSIRPFDLTWENGKMEWPAWVRAPMKSIPESAILP